MTDESYEVPTTAEVRACYQSTGDGLDFKRRYFERATEFEEWLRGVQADAHDEGFREGNSMVEGSDPNDGWNPYRD